MTLKQDASKELLDRARAVRKGAEAVNDRWIKELLEHIAQEYERAAERASILNNEAASGKSALARSKTSLFAIQPLTGLTRRQKT